MKLSKEELKNKINELVQDNELAITLLEDIEDSMEVQEVDTTQIDELQSKLNDLQQKYKERFLSGEELNEENDTPELEEKEVIDIKEI